MIERFHRSLKSSLRARASESDWVSHLPLVLLGLRSVPKEDTGFSVSEAVYGSPLTIPGEFLEAPEIPSLQFISKVEKVIAGFSTPPPIMFNIHLQLRFRRLSGLPSLCLLERMPANLHSVLCIVVLTWLYNG